MSVSLDNPRASDTAADERWQAILRHDAQYEDAFVFGVRTTGVYCRTTCPGRRPLRKNVEFFDGREEARAAGYRACKRCNPDSIGPHARAVDIVTRAHALMDAAADEHPVAGALAQELGVTGHALRRAFVTVLGVTPRQFADTRRLQRFKSGVRNGHAVTDALYESGYGSPSRLYEKSDARLGMTPGQYKQGGAGASISYAIVDSSMGRLLVAATEKGVCRIALADDDQTLENALEREFPRATRTPDDGPLQEWVGRVARIVGGQPQESADSVPLDVQGTAFQRRVWEALRRIPQGETRTYTEVATAIGQPTATRAVANACARNPVPVVVPCHRVVRADGSLGGYALGVERKRDLLEREGVLERGAER